MIWFGKSFIKFVGALLNLTKLLSTHAAQPGLGLAGDAPSFSAALVAEHLPLNWPHQIEPYAHNIDIAIRACPAARYAIVQVRLSTGP